MAIGDAVADGDAFKVKANKIRVGVLVGLLGTSSTERQRAFDLPNAYCWETGAVTVFDPSCLRPYIAGKGQSHGPGSVKAGDVLLFKRSGGELRVRLANGTVRTMPVPKDETLYVFANMGCKDDEVELLPVSPAEAATL